MLNFNRPEHPDDALLEDARMAASTDWEEKFVADMIAARTQYGLRFELSERRRATLEKIAGY